MIDYSLVGFIDVINFEFGDYMRICKSTNTYGAKEMPLSQADRLRTKIEDDILAFRLKPGDRLDESKLAEKYGTSRTPVREALRQLSSNGLIEIRPHKGAIVAVLSIRDLVELFEVMAELEGACGRLAAKSCLRTDIEGLRQALEECKHLVEANDTAGYHLANEAFHDRIYKASHNACLIKLTVAVRNRASPYRRLLLEQVNRLETSAVEHEKIFDAIVNGHADLADTLLQSHIVNKDIRRVISLVSNRDSDTAMFESKAPRFDDASRFASLGFK